MTPSRLDAVLTIRPWSCRDAAWGTSRGQRFSQQEQFRYNNLMPPPACYALTVPGLEPIAAQEIDRDFQGKVRKTEPGLIVFRDADLDRSLLRLRTVEDVFLLAWGTDQLSYRAKDLEQITRWTAREANWPELLRVHHAIRPKPKGKPTYRLVVQMHGQHGYRRVDALKALARGLEGKLPASWKLAEEGASVEVWLTIDGARAVCGLRLSDRTLRHRTYKQEHVQASLRPVVAAAMVRLADAQHDQLLVDPMCGAGTILAERLAVDRSAPVLGGDIEHASVRAAYANLRAFGEPALVRWDAIRLPLPKESVPRIACNPPFGKQLGEPAEVAPLYRRFVGELDRVLTPGGRAVFLVMDTRPLEQSAGDRGWQRRQRFRLRLLGQGSNLLVWEKPPG